MTSIFFVRHAQPKKTWSDDRTMPLTPLGLEDRSKVTSVLLDFSIDIFISSPYKRSFDTIADCAEILNMNIHTDERLRERKGGENSRNFLQERWNDFDFAEEGGECLRSVQTRNMEAISEILLKHKNKKIVLGTHGTALSTILNNYDPSFGCDDFKRIWNCMPYIIRLDFEKEILQKKTELLSIERGY